MSFLKRLGFFLFGLSIGIVFLVFFFKNKAKETGTEFCYLPNCRVLKDLRSKSYSYSDEVTSMLASGEIDSLEIKAFFINGDVDFKNSDTKSKPCKIYLINQEIDDKEQTLKVTNCPNKIVIESIQ
tara:strand:- start:180313 stop:180690 length:378 start_codon:yes stop_codon:yes gene_type:complete